jgi:hypothetical protein
MRNSERLLSGAVLPYRERMASNKTELRALKKLIAEADLILSTTDLPQTAPPDAANCSSPLWP